ncbi:hypothetical protein [Streptomyces sp. SM12]|uniref:hypothetical protein n=1 Tax=Streptomyces sp. SM12 TaxID=1071602 RepID=UPI000CD575A4|nr:hypothetical protein [Streptomyces sp. SM12]
MSAREELFDMLTDGRIRPSADEAARTNALIDAFAHELAKQIRNTGPQPGPGNEFGDGFTAGKFAAADLIDPGVKS